MPAEDREVAEAQEEGVKFVFLTAPKEILAKDGKVSSLKVEIMELSEERDAKGRRKPIGTGEFKEIKANNVIAAIGQKVDLGGIAPENMLFNRNGTPDRALQSMRLPQGGKAPSHCTVPCDRIHP